MPAHPSPREVFARLLAGITDGAGSRLAELYAEDAVVDQPFAPAAANQIRGRDALRARFAAAAAGPLDLAAHNVVVRETDDPEVVVAEFDYHGRVSTSGRSFRVANIQVLRVRDGLIVSSRDYHDHRAIAEALTGPPTSSG